LLRDRYVAGVANAEFAFDQHLADEDALTGALGQSLATLEPVVFDSGEQQYVFRLSYRKIRGRGHDAPEKRYGADGVFQIEVTDRTETVLRRKALPFQSKKNWRGKDKRLAEQASVMNSVTPGGIVVDYAATGYRACTTQAVIAAGGSRRAIERFGSMHPLGQMLSRDFLDCTLGVNGLFYDPGEERFVDYPQAEFHLIATSIMESNRG
jgi:hypothetical protein